MLKKMLGLFLVLVVLGVGGGVAAWLSLKANLPPMIALSDYKPLLVSEVYDRKLQKIGEFFKQKRELLSYDNFPEQLKQAFIAAEDAQFWQHKGLNYVAMLRAFLANLKAGDKVQGASTITQQVARTLLLTREKTYIRKAKEIMLAQQMEANLSKEDILYLYLNQIYLGHGAWGVGQAAKVYFRKSVQELSLAEMAILAGLPKAPGRYTPLLNPQRAKQRQAYVLARMLAENFITDDEAQAARNEAVKIYLRQEYTKAPYYIETLRQVLIELVGEKALLEEGLQIYTALDIEQQIQAQQSVRQGLRALDKRQGYRGAERNLTTAEQIEEFLQQSRAELLREYTDERWLLPEHLNTTRSVVQVVHHDPRKRKHKEFHFMPLQEEDQNTENQNAEEASANSSDTPSTLQGTVNEGLVVDEGQVPLRGFLNRPSYIKQNQIVQGVVTQLDDALGLVYVRLADAQGLIDVESMTWARAPDPDVSFKNADPVEKPSSCLNKGDVILVRLTEDTFKPTERLQKILKQQKSRQIKQLQNKSNKLSPEQQQKLQNGGLDFSAYVTLELEQEPQAQAGLVALDQSTQDLVAMVGGYDFQNSKFNRTIQAARQTGSSFKPIVYLAALDKGYTPSSIVVDAPVVYEDEEDEEKKWRPQNDGRRFRGDVLFRNALIRSMNVPTLKIIEDIGVARVMDYAQRLGIFSPLNRDYTLALGSSSVTLYEIVRVFSQLGRGGRKINPRLITLVKRPDGETLLEDIGLDYKFQDQIKPLESRFKARREKYLSQRLEDDKVAESLDAQATDKVGEDGTSVSGRRNGEDTATAQAGGAQLGGAQVAAKNKEDGSMMADQDNKSYRGRRAWESNFFFPNEQQLIRRETAFVATTLLQGAIDEPGGTGAAARSLGRPAAGKTGSTSNYYDAWFVGYTPDVAAGVWVGYDQERSLGRGEVGGRAALPIWLEFMKFAHKDLPIRDFTRPDNIVYASIDNETGGIATPVSQQAVRQAFVEGTEPQIEAPREDDSQEQDFLKEDLVE